MIKVYDEIIFSEKGKRDNNEDNAGAYKGKIYVVCDGVGGHEKGEIASEIVVNTFLNGSNSTTFLSEMLQKAEHRMSEYIKEHPASLGMGTTLTALQIRDNGINVGWVGDSRIYQFRNGQIIFKSKDHSWVNEAVAAGIITEKEAINHPKSNIITRAIQGAQKPTKVQEVLLTNIKEEDTFFLCSDGVLETWSDEDFTALFSSETDLNSLSVKIKKECAINSKDNYTGLLLRLKSVEGIIASSSPLNVAQQISNDQIVEAIEVKPNASFSNSQQNNSTYSFGGNNQVKSQGSSFKRNVIIFLALVLLLGVIAFFYSGKSKTAENPVDQNEIENTRPPKKEIENIQTENTTYSDNPNLIIANKRDSLLNGKVVYLDTTLINDKNSPLYKAYIQVNNNSWMYRKKPSDAWKNLEKAGKQLEKIFPNVVKSVQNIDSETVKQPEKKALTQNP